MAVHMGNTDETRNSHGLRHEAGFTLIELLIVISIVVILMLVLIPQLTSVRISGNEAAAKIVLKNITTAEIQYSTENPDKGFTCNIADLTGAGDNTRSYLDKKMAAGQMAGYNFTLSGCNNANKGATAYYQLIAQPQVVGKTGKSSFCTDPNGSVASDPTGGTACLNGTGVNPAGGASPTSGSDAAAPAAQ